MSLAIQVDSVGKCYRLGEYGRRSFFHEWKNKLLRRADPDDAPGNFWALRDISFDVEQGEVVAIIGHNGAGKSTLLKILSSITSPTRGAVRLRGRVASLLEVGTGFHQELTGRDNVFLNGAILGMSRREVASKFDDIVAFSEIGEFIDTPVKRYSSGMRVRLAFAVAAHLEPEILIVDEVLAVGDANFQQRCVGKMGEVSKSGRTVLFVSHNAAAVENLCRRGVVLHHGRKDFDGTQTAALQHYMERFSANQKDLSLRTDRTGSGEVRVTGVDFRTLDGKPVTTVTSGEPLEVCIRYACRDERSVPRIVAHFHATTPLGVRLSTHSNYFTGQLIENPPARGTLICRLETFPFTEGSYRFDVGLFPNFRARSAYDELGHAAELNVMASDFFGGGKMPTPAAGDGHTLLRGSWSLEA